jgi:hypothetical protein
LSFPYNPIWYVDIISKASSTEAYLQPDFIFEKMILILSNEPLDVPLNDEDLLHDESVPVQRTEINENSSNCINIHNQIPPERLLNH